MQVNFKTGDMASYRQFLRLKKLPTYSWVGTSAIIPDEYSHLLDGETTETNEHDIECSEFLFDYQRAIAEMAIRKQKFAVFADCGLGKTAILLEFAKHAAKSSRKVLIVSPLMVIPQTIDEAAKFYPGMDIAQINAANLQYWLNSTDSLDSQIGITNYEAIREDLTAGQLDALILDESSMLKSHYGAWGTRLIDLGRGLKWKLALTGTPAPNDRIEYANHAVFCDHFRTVNEFLARYFVNRGETQNRWEIKPHALKPFYRDLSHWCIFLTNPATYGWKDNCGTIPPINVHIDYIDLTGEQRKASQSLTGGLFVNSVGGIGSRGKLSQLAKGRLNGEDVATNKPEFIRQMVESWPDESTLVWCRYNDEQDAMERVFPDAGSIKGDTPLNERLAWISWFKGEICTCERQRRSANTCKSIITKIDTDGKNARQNSKLNTTSGVEKSMPHARAQAAKLGQKPGNGSKPIHENDSTKGCENTELQPSSMNPCSLVKTVDAPFAGISQQAANDQQAVCTSTIVMQRELSGGCCAGTAITGLESSKTQSRYSNQRQCTCDDGKPKGRILISKARVLGFGLNLQIATRQVFSGLQDSYEEFYQAVKRSNRVGSTKPLNVHIPITELEEPMIQTVLEKAKRVQADTEQQEKLFLEVAMNSPERIGRSKGYAAGYEGLPRTDNPGGAEGDAWDRGWVDGNASIQSEEPHN